MAKSKKTRTSLAEDLKARRVREEIEKNASLPPGLVNNTNTCFFNSVLQALNATASLESIVRLNEHPNNANASSSTVFSSSSLDRKGPLSPALTNGKIRGYEWEDTMPISDEFLQFINVMWSKRSGPDRMGAVLSPRQLLATLGTKYPQYMDFGQQDAHELLRHLLDGMHMEEYDVIKRRQPLPVRRRKASRPSSPAPSDSSESNFEASSTAREDSNDVGGAGASGPTSQIKWAPFPDMVFGGKLASIVVCEACKHISHVYEDFMDLSLSIKPDEKKERKRDKLKTFAQKLLASTSQPGVPHSHSAPTLGSPASAAAILAKFPVPEFSLNQSNSSAELRTTARPKDELKPIDGDRADRADEGIRIRLGRRVSTTLGISPPKAGKLRDKSTESVKSQTGNNTTTEKAKEKEKEPGTAGNDQNRPEARPVTPQPSPPRPLFPRRPSLVPRKSKVGKAPRPTEQEAAYLRAILRDDPTSQQTLHAPSLPAHNLWLKLGAPQGGLVDCLRQFTAVEPLDGDNLFACRNCWKLANPHLVQTRGRQRAGDDADESDTDTEQDSLGKDSGKEIEEKKVEEGGASGYSTPLSDLDGRLQSLRPPSTSAINIYDPSLAVSATSVASSPGILPSSFLISDAEALAQSSSHANLAAAGPITTSNIFGGQPIPSISTTSPDVPEASLPTPLTRSPFRRFSSAHPSDFLSPSSSRDSLVHPSPESKSSKLRHRRNVSKSDGEEEFGSAVASDGDDSEVEAPSAKLLLQETSKAPIIPAPSLAREPAPAALSRPPRSQQYIHRRALKRYLIATPPPVLVIHLKRFQQVAQPPISVYGSFKKIDDYVSFPEYLDLRPFIAPRREDYGLGRKGKEMTEEKKTAIAAAPPGLAKWRFAMESERVPAPEPANYRLYAVVVHIGNMVLIRARWFYLGGLAWCQLGGHYISYVALPSNALPTPPPSLSSHDTLSSVASADAQSSTETPAGPPSTSSSSIPPPSPPPNQHQHQPAAAERLWCYISDTTVRLVPFTDVLKAKAYLCFYERV
ncbi:hypothetical protein BOTBODRAFT_47094 [Botryobasidium botryosum FD-172 SS1]|uniref:USP domain-containing protein n=1 Tax=Botryobasidium botryosum (strain FD-172 SS1) TaxID=930990 RepID=A0A067MFS7_BOTB1|nr:hypothetical protein BOTBODRAFT_47094 [Botryobasidium botryosum FD-172 SS1]